MGIDIYLEWEGMNDKDKKAQITGFDITKGNKGYLREAYHGEPYATHYFVKEAFEVDYKKDKGAYIKAKILKERLTETKRLVIERHKKVYKEIIKEEDGPIQSYVGFVKLAKMLERKKIKYWIVASF